MARRPSWEATWMAVADTMARRSPCSRRGVGAVIVDKTNRIVATGYNGFPAGLQVREHGMESRVNPQGLVRPSCFSHCPRAQPDAEPGLSYDSCLTIHAEANALMFCDRREREGGTLYVTSACCVSCAKLVANSGISKVWVRVTEADAHREPEKGIGILEASGLRVGRWEDRG